MLRTLLIITIPVTVLFSGNAFGATSPKAPFGGVLYRSLFVGASPELRLSDLNRELFAALPGPAKKRLSEYISRRAAFRSRLKAPDEKTGPELKELFHKRLNMERSMVALITAPGIEMEAANYAEFATLYYEWEGDSSAPLEEASDAEEFLGSPADTQLRPYLLLFILHRYRCAFETLVAEKNTERAQEIAGKYREMLKLAREHSDPLVGLLADDLDGVPENLYMPSRYTGGNVHP